MKKKARCSNELIQEANSLGNESKVLLKQIATHLQINPVILGHWIKAMNQPEESVLINPVQVRDTEISALMGELSRVEKERDFLKEAESFLTKEPN